jgi:serine protease Do
VPVDALKPILAELRERGSTAQSRRAWLGVNSVERNERIVVARVTRGSPADAAGITVGDEITAIDGNAVRTLEALYKALWANPQTDREVVLTVRQGDITKTVRVRTTDRMQTLKKPSGI